MLLMFRRFISFGVSTPPDTVEDGVLLKEDSAELLLEDGGSILL